MTAQDKFGKLATTTPISRLEAQFATKLLASPIEPHTQIRCGANRRNMETMSTMATHLVYNWTIVVGAYRDIVWTLWSHLWNASKALWSGAIDLGQPSAIKLTYKQPIRGRLLAFLYIFKPLTELQSPTLRLLLVWPLDRTTSRCWKPFAYISGQLELAGGKS
jgi:hypothetical protein